MTLSQKKILSDAGLKSENWMCRFEDNNYLHIVNKKSGNVRIIDKTTREATKSNYKYSRSGGACAPHKNTAPESCQQTKKKRL